MKRIIGIFSVLLCMSTQIFAASANDLVLIYRVPAKDQEKIYYQFVDKTFVGKATGYQVRNYHATVGWFRNIGKASNFRKFMQNEFKNKATFNYTFGEAGLLQVSPKCPVPTPGNKKCTQNALVIYPDDNTRAILKTINQELNDAVDRYNRDFATKQERDKGIKYKMDPDVLPEYYAPHITLADTKQINKKDRQKAVDAVNEQMKANADFHTTELNGKKKK